VSSGTGGPCQYDPAVARFLSPEWLAEVDSALRTSPAVRVLARAGPLTVEQRVTGAPDGDVAYHLTVDDAGARVRPGSAPRADVVLVVDYPAACALHDGTDNAQGALAAGRLALQGNPEAVLARSEALAALDDALGAVRARTTFPEPAP
jgi:hypothetical protein